jgi:thiol-disulfide isomerase/thioredoxin
MQKDATAMDNTIRKGPLTLVLVFSTSCPHCHTYMPIWKKLCQTKGRTANMISMEASTYQQTPLAQKKQVSGVPTVLYINKQGEISEIEKPRDTEAMKSVIRNTPNQNQNQNQNPSMPSSSQGPTSTPSWTPSPSATDRQGVRESNSELKVLPARGGSRGGSWDMLLSAAQQAVPAAALLGAYAAFPMQRSSGLGPARTTRRRRQSR